MPFEKDLCQECGEELDFLWPTRSWRHASHNGVGLDPAGHRPVPVEGTKGSTTCYCGNIKRLGYHNCIRCQRILDAHKEGRCEQCGGFRDDPASTVCRKCQHEDLVTLGLRSEPLGWGQGEEVDDDR